MMKRAPIIDLLAVTALALIPLCSFVVNNGFSIIPAMTDLNVSPSFYFSNLFYSWHPYYEAGFDNSQSSWFLFPLGLGFTILGYLHITIEAISLFFIFLVYLLHGVSMYFLMSVMENINGALPRFSKIIAASFYMFNPFTLLYMHELGSQQLLASAILPFMLGLLIQGFFRRKLSYCIGIGLISVFAGANVTFFVIDVFVLLFYVLYDLILSRRTNFLWKLSFTGAMVGIILASNMYWLFPRISNLTSEMSAAFRGGESIDRSLILNSLASSYPETFRLLGSWAFQPLYFSFYGSYFSSIVIIATFAAPLIATSTLILRPRKKLELFFALLAIVCIPLAVAAYPVSNPSPIGKIYVWLYQNMPFFIIFRGAYKFVMVIALSYATLAGMAYAKIVRANFKVTKWHVEFWKRSALRLAALSLIFLLLLSSWPSFSGRIVEKEKNFNIPQYYYQAETWLEAQSGDFRIMTFPEMMHVQCVWDGQTKLTVTDVSIPVFKIPIIGRSYYLPLGSPDTDEVAHMLYRMIMANQTLDLADALKFLNVKYIMIHADYKWSILEWNMSPSQIIEILDKTPDIAFARSFGELYFFRNLKWSDYAVFALSAPSEDSPQSLFTSITSDFDPEMNENSSNWRIENNVLRSNDIYSYPDDVVLSKGGYTDLTVTFDAKSSNGYIHLYFFAKNKQNSYRLWLNSSTYELGKLEEGKYAIERVQNHGFLFNLSNWNSYQVELRETSIKIALNGDWFDIVHKDRGYIAGRVGFASTTNNLWVESIRLQYRSVGKNAMESYLSDYVRFNPTSYMVYFRNVSKPVVLVLAESYHEGWDARIEGDEHAGLTHVKVLNYANGWYINRTGEFAVTLEYAPQRSYDLGLKASFLFFVACLTYLTYSYTKNKAILKRIKTTLKRNKLKTEVETDKVAQTLEPKVKN